MAKKFIPTIDQQLNNGDSEYFKMLHMKAQNQQIEDLIRQNQASTKSIRPLTPKEVARFNEESTRTKPHIREMNCALYQ